MARTTKVATSCRRIGFAGQNVVGEHPVVMQRRNSVLAAEEMLPLVSVNWAISGEAIAIRVNSFILVPPPRVTYRKSVAHRAAVHVNPRLGPPVSLRCQLIHVGHAIRSTSANRATVRR